MDYLEDKKQYEKASSIIGIMELKKKRGIERRRAEWEELHEPSRTMFGVEYPEGEIL